MILLVLSWIVVLFRALWWRGPEYLIGVPVKDYVSQSTVFLICAFAFVWLVSDALRERHWRTALWLAGLAVLFLANIAFVAASRTALAVIAVLILLFGWRQFGWKGVAIACIAGAVLTIGLWESSVFLRSTLIRTVNELQAYQISDAANPTGERLEFFEKSMTFIREAPLIGGHRVHCRSIPPFCVGRDWRRWYCHGQSAQSDFRCRNSAGSNGNRSTSGRVDSALPAVPHSGLDSLDWYRCRCSEHSVFTCEFAFVRFHAWLALCVRCRCRWRHGSARDSRCAGDRVCSPAVPLTGLLKALSLISGLIWHGRYVARANSDRVDAFPLIPAQGG